MSFISGAAHLVGNVVGPVEQAAGSIGSVGGLFPNKYATAATNAGHAITNPNVHLTNPGNLFTSGSAFTYTPPTHVNNPSGSQSNANLTGSTYDAQAAQQAAQTAKDNAAYNSYKTEANNDLSTLLGSYNATTQGLRSKYGIQQNQLDSGQKATQATYNDNVNQQNQNLLRQQNQSRQDAYQAYNNLMNLLGAYGAGGSSVAQQWAPEAAQHFLTAQLNGANQTTAANLKNLDTAYNNYMLDYKNQKDKVNDALNSDLATAKSQYNTTRDSLNRIIGRINDQTVTPDQIASDLGGIDVPNIQYVKPSYTGITPVYHAPSLDSFRAADPTSSFAAPSTVSNSSTTPALVYLMQQQQKQQQPTIA